MAFPYVLESNFEQGTNAEWTSETDSGSQLDYPHASVLAGVSGSSFAPFRGAYCARWKLGANTTDAYLISTTIDIADAATASARWYMFLGNDFQFTADDVVSIFKLTQAGAGTVEYTVGLNLVAASDEIFLGGSDGTAAGTFGSVSITRNKWHCIEVTAKVSTSDVGQITTYLDGAAQVTSAANLDQGAAVGDGALGIMDRLSTTTGTVLMDAFVFDDLRVYPIVTRYPRQLFMTKTAHAFIGPGVIENVTLMSGSSTDSVVAIYDTNRANTSDVNKLVLELKGIAANDPIDPAGVPVYVSRGAYVVLTGTAPRAMVTIHMAPGYGSEGAVRQMASRLRVNPLEVL